jgi:hypothetical protein
MCVCVCVAVRRFRYTHTRVMSFLFIVYFSQSEYKQFKCRGSNPHLNWMHLESRALTFAVEIKISPVRSVQCYFTFYVQNNLGVK